MGWDKVLAAIGGGALGSLLRYLIGVGTSSWTRTFPWSTLLINLVGCLAIGVVQPMVRERPLLLVFLVPGILGGFTTFSAFGHETYELVDRGATGLAVVYVALSVGVGIAAVFLGRMLIK